MRISTTIFIFLMAAVAVFLFVGDFLSKPKDAAIKAQILEISEDLYYFKSNGVCYSILKNELDGKLDTRTLNSVTCTDGVEETISKFLSN